MSTLLDALGYLGDSLDKPGRAVRGLFGGRPDELAAAIPFSDSMGLTDPSRRTSGRDILSQLGMDPGDGLGGTAAGMGVEMALDPLTYLGAGIGARLGTRAGEAAATMGPRYGTTMDDMLRGVNGLPDFMQEGATRRLRTMAEANPNAFSEVDPAARILGAGAEGVAFQNPGGDVTRLGLVATSDDVGRPVSEHVLQATRGIDYPGAKFNVRAERLPYADQVGNEAMWTQQAMDEFNRKIGSSGLALGDDHAGNLGLLRGRPVMIDPGAVDTLPNFAGAYQPIMQSAEPSALMKMLIGLGGGDEATRSAIAAGRSGPSFTRGFAAGGGGLGANLGAWGRQ